MLTKLAMLQLACLRTKTLPHTPSLSDGSARPPIDSDWEGGSGRRRRKKRQWWRSLGTMRVVRGRGRALPPRWVVIYCGWRCGEVAVVPLGHGRTGARGDGAIGGDGKVELQARRRQWRRKLCGGRHWEEEEGDTLQPGAPVACDRSRVKAFRLRSIFH
jgi:hypothetical protein